MYFSKENGGLLTIFGNVSVNLSITLHWYHST